MTLPSSCPLCAAYNNDQSVITPHVYGDYTNSHAFFKCNNCDVIYLFPQLSAEQEKEFYSKEFESFMNSRAGDKSGWKAAEKHINANQIQFNRRMNYMGKILPTEGKILEFGCSSGFMLYPFAEKGYECYGIEPSNNFSEYLISQGINLITDADSISEKFDVVMHFFVLEHIKDPAQFIKMNLNLLKPNGKLIIEIPNAADPLYTIYNIPEFEKFYWSIAHHWYFTESSFCYLLNKFENIKYEIIRDQRYDLSNHIIWARDGKPGGMNKFSTEFGIELDKLYKERLIESGKCDTLIALISKTL